jgi:hypothetical protein
MANRIDATYVATEYLGSLETDVFEFAPKHYVQVEQHRDSKNRVYQVGEKETLCWSAASAVLLN